MTGHGRLWSVAFVLWIGPLAWGQVPPAPSSGAALVPPPLAQAVRMILDEGSAQPLTPEPVLRELHARAVSLAGGESPYLDYALAIVLQKNGQQASAEPLIRAVAETSTPVGLLAREDLCYQQLRAKTWYGGVRGLVDMAKSIAAVPEGSPESAAALRSAEWIGRALGYLVGPLGDPEVAALAEDARLQIETWLGPFYATACQAGREAVNIEAQGLRGEITLRIATQEQKLQAQGQAAQEKAAQSAVNREQLQEQAEKLKAIVEETNSDLSSRLSAIEKNYYSSLEAEQRLLTIQSVVQLELQNYKNQLANLDSEGGGRRGGGNGFRRRQLEQLIQARQLELATIQQDYAFLLSSRDSVVQLANGLAQQQQAVNANLNQQLAGNQIAADQLANVQRKFEAEAKYKSEKAAEDDPAIRRMQRRVTELSTYVRRTTTEQRERLELLLGLPPVGG